MHLISQDITEIIVEHNGLLCMTCVRGWWAPDGQTVQELEKCLGFARGYGKPMALPSILVGCVIPEQFCFERVYTSWESPLWGARGSIVEDGHSDSFHGTFCQPNTPWHQMWLDWNRVQYPMNEVIYETYLLYNKAPNNLYNLNYFKLGSKTHS